MAMMTIGGVNIPLTLDGGIGSQMDDLSDRGRSISGSLLITQLSSTAGDRKETLSCQTRAMTTAEVNTLVSALDASAIVAVTGDIGAANMAARIIGINPVTLPGPTRHWVVSFELSES